MQQREQQQRGGVAKNEREEQEISSLVYWGEQKNTLICTSWDQSMYVFDDQDPEARDGQFRYKIENRKPNSKQNYVDFCQDSMMSAIACEDGYVTVQN